MVHDHSDVLLGVAALAGCSFPEPAVDKAASGLSLQVSLQAVASSHFQSGYDDGSYCGSWGGDYPAKGDVHFSCHWVPPCVCSWLPLVDSASCLGPLPLPPPSAAAAAALTTSTWTPDPPALTV